MSTPLALPASDKEPSDFVERELMRFERDLQLLVGELRSKKTKTLGNNLDARYGRVQRDAKAFIGRHFVGDAIAERVLDHLGSLWGRTKLREATQSVETACQLLGELRIHFNNQRYNDLQQRVQQLQFSLDTATKNGAKERDTTATARPSDLAKPSSVFVIMPFAEAFADVWSGAIQRATRTAGFEPIRVDMINRSSDITDDVIESISNCHAAIVDVTGANPNVMFELGFALAKGKPQIIISQSTDYLPFDIRNLRTVVYQNSWVGIEQLQLRLYEFLRELPNQQKPSKKSRRKSVARQFSDRAEK